MLGTTQRPGQLVILNNLRVHTAVSIRRAGADLTHDVLFLALSSPNGTPIEQAFCKLYELLRGLAARTRVAPPKAVRRPDEDITPHDAADSRSRGLCTAC